MLERGQKVVIKPNIGWNRTVEFGATTHPKLIKRIIGHYKEAGAKKIYVFDNPCDFWEYLYKNSGIGQAAKEAGATAVPADNEKYYQKVKVPKGKVLKNTIGFSVSEKNIIIDIGKWKEVELGFFTYPYSEVGFTVEKYEYTGINSRNHSKPN